MKFFVAGLFTAVQDFYRLSIHNHVYTVEKETKCSGDSKILQEIVRDTTLKSQKHELIPVVSRIISCSISDATIHFIFFLTVHARHFHQADPPTFTIIFYTDVFPLFTDPWHLLYTVELTSHFLLYNTVG